MTRNILLFAALLTLTGCTHTVKYWLNEEDHWAGPKINKTVAVQTFTDRSAPETRKEIRIGKEVWRTNYRSRYVKTNLNEAVSAMVTKHLAHSGLFRKVTTAPDPHADLTLSGILTEYSATARVNSGAETVMILGAGFGLVGGVVSSTATLGAQTEVHVSVKLDDVKLTGKSGEVLWRDSIAFQTNSPAYFQNAGTEAVFRLADNGLKEAVAGMIRRIAEAQATNRTATASR